MVRSFSSFLSASALMLALSACPTGSGSDDSGTNPDPSSPADSGTSADSGAPTDWETPIPDAGETVQDAGPNTPDAGETIQDAGPNTPDAGETIQDAGPNTPDAGETVQDAGSNTPDAGETVQDAGLPPMPDAGLPPMPDAGYPEADAGVPQFAGCGTLDTDFDGIPDLCDACPGSETQGAGLTRTPWQMHEGGFELGARDPYFRVDAPCITTDFGAVCMYDAAAVPQGDDSAWTSAPDPEIIAFSRASTVPCFDAVDFTYFQTFVSVPITTTVNQFTIDLTGMDDGSRISIYNAANPDGLIVEGSYVSLGQTATADLSSYLVPGINRVVITQMDVCATGNNLGSALITLNSGNVSVGTCGCDDADEDGICDVDDRCPGQDDALDIDGDGVPDGCDACPNDDQVGVALTRTPWEMHEGGLETGASSTVPYIIAAPCSTSIHGETCLYGAAVIPVGDDLNWGSAPDPDVIGFRRSSTLQCFAQVDYTYFQTFVNVPEGTPITSFTIDFSGMDDGSRISIFNVDNPTGLVVPGSYVLGGASGTTDLAGYLSVGANRVVVTQVDDCASGNNLQSAVTTLNGGSIGVGICACIDTDNDGICDDVDVCAGFDDTTDSDNDGTPDGCDLCEGFDDTLDIDGDGVPLNCDICVGYDDGIDTDLDGTPDDCDVCEGSDDDIDTDNDGWPDGCDICEGFNDNADSDNDDIPDGCDVCSGYDDATDSDTDGVPDGCDVCSGYDDAQDTDADGVPDGCDVCEGSDDAQDTDADGVPDGCDVCSGYDDAQDTDADGVPDGCDVCPGNDDAQDGDGDGIPDGCDACPTNPNIGTDLTRTPWEMHDGGLEPGATTTFPYVISAPCSTNIHGDSCLYAVAVVPEGSDASWTSAPDGDIIGFSRGSSLTCFQQVDYTYFQTFVNVPANYTIASFTVDFSGMDDGSRISIYNADNPTGLVVPGSYVLGGGSGTTDLASYLSLGVNRIVVTQIDDCASGNNLGSAITTLNGGSVAVGVCN